MTNRRPVLVVVGVVVTLLAIVALSQPRQDPYLLPDLSPRGTGPRGMAAAVELLDASGADVVVGGRPGSGDDVVFQAVDTMSESSVDDLDRWVRRGGRLVVADPFAWLAPPIDWSGDFFGATVRPDTCDLRALASVDQLSVAMPRQFRFGLNDASCFGNGQQAAVVSRSHGAGLIVAVSSVEPFVNDNLSREDNARFVVSLLAPVPGETVRVLDPNRYLGDDSSEGDGTIIGALGDRGRQALLQLVVAFLVWGLAHGRRLGQVVDEDLPVNLPASDLVLAVAELLGRGDDVAAVARRLRRSAIRDLGTAVGLGANPMPEDLVVSLTPHVTADPAAMRRALTDPVSDIDTLMSVAHDLDRLRKEIHVSHSPT